MGTHSPQHRAIKGGGGGGGGDSPWRLATFSDRSYT